MRLAPVRADSQSAVSRVFGTLASLILLAAGTVLHAHAQCPSSASQAFQAGRFAEAENCLKALPPARAQEYDALLLSGRIALFSNRFSSAEQFLKEAITLKPREREPRLALAQVYWRQDEFELAAAQLHAAGKEQRARQAESFANRKPYRIETTDEVTSVRFLQTDPLPVIRVGVGGDELNFVIDTGGAQVILDDDLATHIGIQTFGSVGGTFAAGRKADVKLGRLDALKLGSMTIHDVPVQILNTKQFVKVIGVPVSGVLGTMMLYHFLSTLDYPGGQLILRRISTQNESAFNREFSTVEHIEIPFWLAKDHYILAHGTVNHSQPLLFLIDTGLAGRGFTAPASTLSAANVSVPSGITVEGVGGGGKITSVPFILNHLSLGAASAENIKAAFGPFPPTLEYENGFRIAGIISHAFFRPYALTFDFQTMHLRLARPGTDPTS